MQETLMQQGLALMAFGLGTVFIFLTVLVFATVLMSAVIQRFVATPASALSVPSPVSSVSEPHLDDSLVAVISAAIHQHRQRRKQ